MGNTPHMMGNWWCQLKTQDAQQNRWTNAVETKNESFYTFTTYFSMRTDQLFDLIPSLQMISDGTKPHHNKQRITYSRLYFPQLMLWTPQQRLHKLNIYFLTIDNSNRCIFTFQHTQYSRASFGPKNEDIVTYVRNEGSMKPHTLHIPPYMYTYCDLLKIYARWLKLPPLQRCFHVPTRKIKQSFESPT